MSETLEITRDMTATVTNRCICMYCDECEMGFWCDDETGYECECGREGSPDIDCMGCWEDMTTTLGYLLEAYDKMNPRQGDWDGFLIVGSGMGWRKRSGYRTLPSYADGEDLARAVGPDTDWAQHWTLTPDGELTCSQSHHDAWGEAYEVLPATLENMLEHGVLSVEDMQADRAADIMSDAFALVSDHPWQKDEQALEAHTKRGITALREMARRIAAAEWEDEALREVAYEEIIDNATYDL